jgi:TrmH family RNA methyltransferase
LVLAARDAGLTLEEVWVAGEAMAKWPWIDDLPCPIFTVSARLLEALADADSPRGVVAIARRRDASCTELRARLSEASPVVVLEGIQEPGNLGAIARTAEASGGAGLVLATGSVHWRHPRALRASTGSLLRQPPLLYHQIRACLEVIGLDQSPGWALVPRDGRSLWEATAETPRWIAVGAEGRGLSSEVELLASQRITIPMAPGVESLNVAAALAVALYELRRRREP